MKKKNKYILVALLVLFLSVGYAYLSTNLDINGVSIVKRNVWDLHFENIVDTHKGATIDIPANISEDKLSIDYQVTLNKPGDEYYFTADVVNNGTMDVMLNSYEITGLSDEQKKFITATVTYSDGTEFKQYDLLEKNGGKDTLKIYVKYRTDIEVEDLPSSGDSEFRLNLTATYLMADENAKERSTKS